MKKLVGIAEHKIGKSPDILTIIGLGSCVAVALYHEKTRTGGLVHIMLPEGSKKKRGSPGKYADTAVKTLFKRIKKGAGDEGKIIAKIAGGSQMFTLTKNFSVGDKNIVAAKKELKKLGIKIKGEDCGKNYGRTINFNLNDGQMKIKSLYGETEI